MSRGLAIHSSMRYLLDKAPALLAVGIMDLNPKSLSHFSFSLPYYTSVLFREAFHYKEHSFTIFFHLYHL